MNTLDDFLDELYMTQERISRDEIYRKAVAAELRADELTALDSLPEGEYAQTEVYEAIALPAPESAEHDDEGVPPEELDEADLLQELASLHRTRHDTFLHASTQALQRHSERTRELELEYLRRHPGRDIHESRLRDGARAR